MADFKQIIQLRNQGKTQEGIADIIGVSKRSVISYLKEGKIPHYSRSTLTKKDSLESFYDQIEEKIKLDL